MLKYDVEAFCSDLSAFLKANLNTKLTAIDADKNDSITLAQFAAGAYFFQTMAAEVANYNPFVFYGIESMAGDNSGHSAVDKILNMFVLVVLADDGNDPNIVSRLLRYQRALIEVFEENFAAVSKLGRIKVSGLAPFPAQLENNSTITRIIGVSLEVHLP